MKKLVSIILTLIIISTAVFSASAYTPIEPRVMAERNFTEYYSDATGGKEISNISAAYIRFDETFGWCFLISFTSADAENVEYFNRFDMYYEESPVTNLLFPSGYVVYATHGLYDPYNPGDFHNLEYFYDNDPSVLEEAAKLCAENTSVFKFGVVCGASTVSDLNVNNVTYMQKVLAGKEVCDGDIKKLDFDNNGKFNINDATALQRYLANIK